MYQEKNQNDYRIIRAKHDESGDYQLYCANAPTLLFCENETNAWELFRSNNAGPYTKDGINNYVVHGRSDAVNFANNGTKASADYALTSLLEKPA